MKHGLTIFKLISKVLSPYDILRDRSCKDLIFEIVIIVFIDVCTMKNLNQRQYPDFQSMIFVFNFI